MLHKALHELGEKAHLNPETFGILNIELQQQSDFQRMDQSNIGLGAARCHIPEPKPTRNMYKNTIRSC
jgi:hypothetical protein